ncbi:MAG: small nuclear ribonucleoprotein Sm D3 [Chaenotheca gracillima]|nr:MAG: small nuclear ribonucleoprotein Sm D3 [Chaenotheca gracillima]
MTSHARIGGRRLLAESVPVLWVIATFFMLWKGVCVITDSPHPLLVVSSGSMEPAFRRGDLIVLWNRQQQIRAGDIPVVWFPGHPLPMVHRAIKVSQQLPNDNGISRQLILTKGDNNEQDDTPLYPAGRSFVYREEIVGLVRGYVPCVGLASLALKSSPWILYVAIGALLAAGLRS